MNNPSNAPTMSGPNVWMEYRKADKQIFARCLKDMNNEPAIYTKSKRGLDKAWAAIAVLMETFPDATLANIMTQLTVGGIKYHYWCMVD